ncbi:unnamed protein product [Symbiodinium sp. CCMP2592]|nr:unnamed protein product [Symbiodinium sp. CCMP2592]
MNDLTVGQGGPAVPGSVEKDVGLGGASEASTCAIALRWQQVPDAPPIALVTDSALTVGQAGCFPQLPATAQAVLLRLPDARTAARVKQADPAVILVDVPSQVAVVPTICRAALGRFRSAAQGGLAAIVAERKAVNVAELLSRRWKLVSHAGLATRRTSRNSGQMNDLTVGQGGPAVPGSVEKDVGLGGASEASTCAIALIWQQVPDAPPIALVTDSA